MVKFFEHTKKFQSVFFLLGLLLAVEADVYASGYKGQFQSNYKETLKNNGSPTVKTTHNVFGFVFHLVDLPLPIPCFQALHQHYQRTIYIAERQNSQAFLVIKPLLPQVRLCQSIAYASTDTHHILLI
ncbi:hypothetical protein [Microscilla marina]|uniref:hypothetical protein n=1 Tax=Microscilla marina TaxID=1027 RepID=UPI0002DCB444|nr:hypothetical protein [Microscilla marina]